MVGAWYWPAWTDQNDFEAVNAQGVFGWRDPWGGVREYALGQDPWKIGGNYSAREPLQGFYDLTNQTVMDTQIREAASRGLSYFAFYWFWAGAQLAARSASINDFVASPYKNLMNFTIVFDSEYPLTLGLWESTVVPYLVSHYVSDPSYLRTTDGRPLIMDWSGTFNSVWQSTAVHLQALQFLRSYVLGALGVNPVILYRAEESDTYSSLSGVQTNLEPDGYFCFQAFPDYPGQDYATRLSELVPALVNQNWPFNIPCTGVGADQRPTWQIGITGYPLNRLGYFTNFSLAALRQNLVNLKSYMDANAASTSKMLTVYAWNEWGEGGDLEPSRVNGYAFLDVFQSVFGLTARTSTPPQNPDAAVLVNLSVPSVVQSGWGSQVQVRMLNTGNTSWTSAAGFALESVSVTNTSVWGVTRVNLSSTDIIAPGQSKVFAFYIRPDPAAGTNRVFPFRWRMVHDGSGQFGDYTPTQYVLVSPGAFYPVTFVERNLAPGTRWSVTSDLQNGTTSNLTTRGSGVGQNSIVINAGMGGFPFSILPPPGQGVVRIYGPGNPNLDLGQVTGPTRWVVLFGPLETLRFNESSLPAGRAYPGAVWSVLLSPALPHGGPQVHANSTNGTSVTFSVPAGAEYRFMIQSPGAEYSASPGRGNLRIPFHSATRIVSFRLLTESIRFKETGLEPGQNWTVTILSGTSPALTFPLSEMKAAGAGPVRFRLPVGNYSYSITATDSQVPSPASGTFTITSLSPYGKTVSISF